MEKKQFFVGLSQDENPRLGYWSTKWLYALDDKSPIRNGYFNVSTFMVDNTDESHRFIDKLWDFAAALAIYINVYELDGLPIAATKDIEKNRLWKQFKKVANEILRKRKIAARGIRIGPYRESYNHSMYEAVCTDHTIGKFIESGEFVSVDSHDDWTSMFYSTGLCFIEGDGKKRKINEKLLREYLVDPRYTTMFVVTR